MSRDALVSEGDVVGTIGPSGTPEVDVPYVHLGTRVAALPQGYVDPLALLPGPPADEPASDGGVEPAPVPSEEPEEPATAEPPMPEADGPVGDAGDDSQEQPANEPVAEAGSGTATGQEDGEADQPASQPQAGESGDDASAGPPHAAELYAGGRPG